MQNIKTDLNIIKSNLKKTFSIDRSLFEIMAIDCFALQNRDKFKQYHALYITPKQCDGKLDAVIIAETHSSTFEALKFEISTGSKDSESILKFINAPLPYFNIDIPRIDSTKNILLTLDTSKTANCNVEIYANDSLLDIISSIGSKYNLLDSKDFVNQAYFKNILTRSLHWQDYHNYYSKTTHKDLYLKILNYFSICNLDRISKCDFNLFANIQMFNNIELHTLLDANFKSEKERFLAYQKFLCLKAPVEGVSEKDIEEILLFVGESIGFSNEDFIIKPTKRYLSIKSPYNNTSFCHIDWNIKKPTNKNAFVGFKGTYEELNYSDIRLKKMVKQPVIVENSKTHSTKTEDRYIVTNSEINNYLKYTMNIALLDINLSTDKSLFKTLLYNAKEKDITSSL